MKTKLLLLIIFVSLSLSAIGNSGLAADECYPTKVTIPGNQISGHIELSEEQSVKVQAQFAGSCQGKKAEFRICYPTYGWTGLPDFSCNEAGTTFNFIANAVAIENGQAATAWTVQKNPTNAQNPQTIAVREISGSIVRQSLPVLVIAGNKETTCKLRGLTAIITSSQVRLTVNTNARCEKEKVVFYICSQNTKGVQECNTNLGQATVQNSTAQVAQSVPPAFAGLTTIFFRAVWRDQTVDSGALGNTDFIQGIDFHNAGTAPKKLTFDFALKNPLQGDIKSIGGLIDLLSQFLLNLAIPISVILILYGGFLMLTSGGVPARYQTGINAVKWAVIGFAIVIIGKGFVALIKSILSIGK